MNISDFFSEFQPQRNDVYVIAEAGVNHNGDLDTAIELIHESKRVGADAVKFQTFKASDIVTQTAPKAEYQMDNTEKTESQYDMLKKLEFDYAAFSTLEKECRTVGIDFLSTPYNVSDVDVLEKIGANAYKIASAMVVEPAFLSYVAATGKPVILSTGMCTLAEVGEAVKILRTNGCENIVLMQCTTNYPASIDEANLKSMVNMGNAFNLPYGYSDHTEGSTAAVVSVALGACVVEKHFTLDKTLPGPDHGASCDPDDFISLISAIRDASNSLGDGIKQATESELINRPMMRRGVVASRDINTGTVIQHEHLAYKRPVTELKPAQVGLILGKPIKRDIVMDEEIKLEYF